MPPTTTWPVCSEDLAPLSMSAYLWDPFFISVSLKQIQIPALIPNYDPNLALSPNPNLAPSPLSPQCDLTLILCHHPDPAPCPCPSCVSPN